MAYPFSQSFNLDQIKDGVYNKNITSTIEENCKYVQTNEDI